MTQAQKTAKAKFKQAIAYRQKTGVSLKEAFAHIYGRKVGVIKKKSAPKKKISNMKVAKYKVGQKVYSYQNKDYPAPINKLVDANVNTGDPFVILPTAVNTPIADIDEPLISPPNTGVLFSLAMSFKFKPGCARSV